MKPDEKYFLILLFFLSLFLHFYKIDKIIPFYSDQAWDAFIVRDFLTEGKFIFLGIRIQDWGAYSAPLFHYLLIPFFYFFKFHPASSAVFCSLTGFISCFVLYFLTKELTNERTAVYSSLLYTLSPLRLLFTRMGWSPVLIFLFSMLLVYSFFKILKGKKWAFFFFPVLFSCCLQFHLSAILLAPFFIAVYLMKKPKLQLKPLILGVAVSLLLLLPFIYYELKNGFINTRIILREVFFRAGITNLFFDSFMQFLFFLGNSLIPIAVDSLSIETAYFTIGAFQYISLAVFLFAFIELKDTFVRLWFLIPSLFAFIYTVTLFPHHLIILFPPMFIIFGSFFNSLKKPGLVVLSLICIYLFYWDVYYFIKASKENLCTSFGIQEQAVRFISDELKYKEFNFVYDYNSSFMCYSTKEAYEYLFWYHGLKINQSSDKTIYIKEFMNETSPKSRTFSYITVLY